MHSDALVMHSSGPAPPPASPAHLGLGAAALLPLAAAVQVAPPLLAGRPLAVDVVVVQEVPSAATEVPLRAVGLARARRLRREARLSQGPLRHPPRSPIPPPSRERARLSGSHGPMRPRRSLVPTTLTRQLLPSAMSGEDCRTPPPPPASQ